MRRKVILFVHDAVIALDLAEILASQLDPIDLLIPKTAAEAADMLGTATFLVTDGNGYRDLTMLNVELKTPHLNIGSPVAADHSDTHVALAHPFTNRTVAVALGALKLRNPDLL